MKLKEVMAVISRLIYTKSSSASSDYKSSTLQAHLW